MFNVPVVTSSRPLPVSVSSAVVGLTAVAWVAGSSAGGTFVARARPVLAGAGPGAGAGASDEVRAAARPTVRARARVTFARRFRSGRFASRRGVGHWRFIKVGHTASLSRVGQRR